MSELLRSRNPLDLDKAQSLSEVPGFTEKDIEVSGVTEQGIDVLNYYTKVINKT